MILAPAPISPEAAAFAEHMAPFRPRRRGNNNGAGDDVARRTAPPLPLKCVKITCSAAVKSILKRRVAPMVCWRSSAAPREKKVFEIRLDKAILRCASCSCCGGSGTHTVRRPFGRCK